MHTTVCSKYIWRCLQDDFNIKKGLITFHSSEKFSEMWFSFEMCFHFSKFERFQNVLSFFQIWNVSKCAFILQMGKVSWYVFSFFRKIVNKFVNKNLTVTTNSFTEEDINKYRNIYKALKFVSVIKNLQFLSSISILSGSFKFENMTFYMVKLGPDILPISTRKAC